MAEPNLSFAHVAGLDAVLPSALADAPQFDGSLDSAWEILRAIPDPEIPVISIVDLGIVRAVGLIANGVRVTVTPTYAGCPATELIQREIIDALTRAGVSQVELAISLTPAWTTDWIAPAAREALNRYGIAPPCATREAHTLAFKPRCPRCASIHTELVSAFGATPCKALFRCISCREPFDYFKPL